jgi:hypothetical protein
MIFQTVFPDQLIALYNQFLSWFLALSIPGQFLTAIFIILGCIAVGYIIYGSFWLAFQIIKASIVTSVIMIYLTITGIILTIELIADRTRLEDDWAEVCYNVKYFLGKAYPRQDEALPMKPVRKVAQASVGTQSVSQVQTRSQQPPVIIIRRDELKTVQEPKTAQEATATYSENKLSIPEQRFDSDIQEQSHPAPQAINEYFCPSCGNKFSPRMVNVLKDQPFTFCEHCGEKFYRREGSSDIKA